VIEAVDARSDLLLLAATNERLRGVSPLSQTACGRRRLF
jgi:hypothetical protein